MSEGNGHAPARLSDLKPDKRNPRKIKSEALVGLGVSIREFGDVSGLVYNARTGNLVCGHQRVKSLTEGYGDLELVDGAVVTPEGHRFPVRVVDWDRATERAANIAANSPSIAGEFTDDLSGLLDEVRIETPDLFAGLRFEDLDALAGVALGGPDVAEDAPDGSRVFQFRLPAEEAEQIDRVFAVAHERDKKASDEHLFLRICLTAEKRL